MNREEFINKIAGYVGDRLEEEDFSGNPYDDDIEDRNLMLEFEDAGWLLRLHFEVRGWCRYHHATYDSESWIEGEVSCECFKGEVFDPDGEDVGDLTDKEKKMFNCNFKLR